VPQANRSFWSTEVGKFMSPASAYRRSIGSTQFAFYSHRNARAPSQSTCRGALPSFDTIKTIALALNTLP
jgi:hypothetical protein